MPTCAAVAGGRFSVHGIGVTARAAFAAVSDDQAAVAAPAALATGGGLGPRSDGSGAVTAVPPDTEQPGIAAVSALTVVHSGDPVAAVAASSEEQAAAAAVLAWSAVRSAAYEKSAVFTRLVTIADEDPHGVVEHASEIGSARIRRRRSIGLARTGSEQAVGRDRLGRRTEVAADRERLRHTREQR
jgi:hypothetical protein